MNNYLLDNIFLALRRISQAMDLHSKKLMQNYGLTGPQLLVLKEISQYPEITTGSLAKNINLSQATVTLILDKLENRGYVQRDRGKIDKRKVYVKLAAPAKDILQDYPSLLPIDFIDKFCQLAIWEQTLLLSSIQRIADLITLPGGVLDLPPPLDKEPPNHT